MPTDARKRYFEVSRDLARAKKTREEKLAALDTATYNVERAEEIVRLAESGVEEAWAAAIDEAEAELEADSNQDGGEG